MELLMTVVAFVVGLAAGALAAIFGIGGAILLIPAFRIIFGMSGQQIVATALPITIPTAVAGSIRYHMRGFVKTKTALLAGVVGSFFAVIGAKLVDQFPSEAIIWMTIALFLLIAYTVGKQAKPRPTSEKSIKTRFHEKAGAVALIGAVGGFVAGFFGIGGGAILVPMLMRFRGISMTRAAPTSLAIIAIYSIPGSVAHLAIGNIDIQVLFPVMLGAVIGSIAAAGMEYNEEKRKDAFRIFLVAVAAVMIANEAIKLVF